MARTSYCNAQIVPSRVFTLDDFSMQGKNLRLFRSYSKYIDYIVDLFAWTFRVSHPVKTASACSQCVVLLCAWGSASVNRSIQRPSIRPRSATISVSVASSFGSNRCTANRTSVTR